MPLSFAISAMVSPARALQTLPSMVISLMRCFSRNGLAMGQASGLETRLPQVEVRDEFFLPVDSLLVELTEILKGRKDRIGRRLSEPAPAQGADILAPGLEVPEVLGRTAAGHDLLQFSFQQGIPDPAGSAPTAGLLDEKIHEISDDLEHVPPRSEDHDGPAGRQVLECEPPPEILPGEGGARGAPDLDGGGGLTPPDVAGVPA